MREVKTSEKQQNPIKLALAVGLTVVFIVVVAIQVKTYSGDANTSTPGPDVGADAQAEEKDDATATRAESSIDERRVVQWPAVDIEECIEYDPFASPESSASHEDDQARKDNTEDARHRELELARERAVRAKAISDLKEAGVRAILKGSDHSMAILGTDTIRVGEEIHGYRVVAIDSHGIVLEPVTEQ